MKEFTNNQILLYVNNEVNTDLALLNQEIFMHNTKIFSNTQHKKKFTYLQDEMGTTGVL